MSLRALRKLQEKQRLENLNHCTTDEKEKKIEVESEENSAESEEGNASFKVQNRFDLFNEDRQSETEAKDNDESSGLLSDTAASRKYCLDVPSASNNQLLANKTGAKKKKRKKKKKNADNIYSSAVNEDKSDADDIEKCIQQVNAILGEVNHIVKDDGNADNKPMKNLLRVEYKHLNPQSEMKRIFGARVVQANETNRKRNPRQSNSGSRANRGACIIQPKPHWKEHSKSGLSMSLLSSNSSSNVFRFVHNTSYQQAQFRFLDAVGSLNPDNILRLLHLEPFHVDTLLQVSEIFRLADDSAMAAQLIERSIFIMESVSHPLFNISAGNARMDYKQQENRGFFIALFRHVLNVGNKGCYRTALELCKLLLSLSPDDDPLAVSLMMDFYAVRAQEYGWLVSLFDLYEPTKNLSMLPNFSFSVPLALFHLSEMDKSPDISKGKGNLEYIGATSSKELRERANDMLQRAILMFPGLVQPLLYKCNVQPDVQLISHPYFGVPTQTSMNKGLSQIVKLYVGRSYHLWKEPDVVHWFEDNFNVCLERFEAKNPVIAECEEKRRIRYQGTPTAIYRHIIISEVKDVTAALPPSLADTPVMSHDPLPPSDSVCDYSPPKPPVPESGSSSFVQSFFRALMPHYDPSAPHNGRNLELVELEGAIGGVEEEMGGAEALGDLTPLGSDLRSSVTSLLEAMRNLFQNINVAENAAAEDADAEEQTDEEGVLPDPNPEFGEWD